MMDMTARHLAAFGRVFDAEEMLAAIDRVSRDDVAALAQLIARALPRLYRLSGR